MTHALVMFEKDNTHWASGLLHKEARHVFCAVPDERAEAMIVHNLTINGLVIANECKLDYDLPQFYRSHGIEVWKVPYQPERRVLLPFLLNSCVGLTKATVGIQSWAVTPQQLRRHLARRGDTECFD